LQSQAEGSSTLRVSCIVSEQPCLNLAAVCSLFVHDVERRKASQRFGGLCLDLSKGLVNQEMQMRPALGLDAPSCMPRLSRYLVMVADISANVNCFPDFQVDIDPSRFHRQ
jgi:hypothetical protein